MALFISHAQNFEDVMLWRALKHVERGFYIDVGAWLPDLDSVTRAFYERGWRGINVEPDPQTCSALRARRPGDINLELAIGDQNSVLEMNVLAGTGLSTLDDSIARAHQQAGFSNARQRVRVMTLSDVWSQHVPPEQDVHFLKVDVEGYEAAVLRGNDWRRYRPWVVVVEATLPNTQIECHEAWESVLLGAAYRFAYADGLNRFYVAEERSPLLAAFKYPPNVHDFFISGHQQRAEARLSELTGSASWQIAAPLRWIERKVRRLLSRRRRLARKARINR